MEVTTCRPDVEPKYYFKSPSSDLKCCGGRSHRSLRTICVKMYVTEVFRLCLCRSWRSASGSAGGSWYRSSSPSWSPWRWRSTSPRVKSCHITDGSCSSYSSSGHTSALWRTDTTRDAWLSGSEDTEAHPRCDEDAAQRATPPSPPPPSDTKVTTHCDRDSPEVKSESSLNPHKDFLTSFFRGFNNGDSRSLLEKKKKSPNASCVTTAQLWRKVSSRPPNENNHKCHFQSHTSSSCHSFVKGFVF